MESASECSFKRVRVRLQLLCCLGLERQAVIAILLHELRDLAFSNQNHFLWLDEQHQSCQFCSYPPPPGLSNILPRVSGFLMKRTAM